MTSDELAQVGGAVGEQGNLQREEGPGSGDGAGPTAGGGTWVRRRRQAHCRRRDLGQETVLGPLQAAPQQQAARQGLHSLPWLLSPYPNPSEPEGLERPSF